MDVVYQQCNSKTYAGVLHNFLYFSQQQNQLELKISGDAFLLSDLPQPTLGAVGADSCHHHQPPALCHLRRRHQERTPTLIRLICLGNIFGLGIFFHNPKTTFNQDSIHRQYHPFLHLHHIADKQILPQYFALRPTSNCIQIHFRGYAVSQSIEIPSFQEYFSAIHHSNDVQAQKYYPCFPH